MLTLFYSVLLSLILSVVVMLISLVIMQTSFMDKEKISPFECGFNPQGSSRTVFCLQFFLVAVIFLVFDVEITLLLPVPVLVGVGLGWSALGFFFVFILLLGLLHEWNQGALEWRY